MADKAIRGLNAGTPVSPGADSAFAFQNTSESTPAVQASFAQMGGLAPLESTPTASFNAVPGTMHMITTTSMTGNIEVRLPAGVPGQRVGVFCVTNEPDHAIILIGGAGQSINGNPAAFEWSRLFIRGECVVFYCRNSTNWIVEVDNRTACSTRLFFAGTATAPQGWSKVGIDSVDYDIGDLADITNNRAVIRRNGIYLLDAGTGMSGVQNNTRCLAGIYINATIGVQSPRFFASDSQVEAAVGVSHLHDEGDVLELYINHGDNNQNYTIVPDKLINYLDITEQLN